MKRIIGDWGIRDMLRGFTSGTSERIPTDGIDMKQWKSKEMENTVVYFWDFAGQELYYATHHFFLKESNINFIVFDCTKSLEENRLVFWLNSVQSMAPGSQIMLIGSFKDKLKDEKRDIEALSNEINKLINLWQTHIPSSKRPKFLECQSNGSMIPFWPLSCTQLSTKKVESLYRR
jgi:GTPase SAR1 family protein